MAHPYDSVSETVRLGSRWATAVGFLRGARASVWSVIPRLILEYAALIVARKVMNTIFSIKPEPSNPIEALLGVGPAGASCPLFL